MDIGSIKLEKTHFEERGLRLLHIDLSEVRKAANTARAVTIGEPQGRLGLIRQRLEMLKPIADDYGLAVSLLTSGRELPQVTRVVREVGLSSSCNIRTLEGVAHAAEFSRSHDPGPPVGDVAIFPKLSLKPEVKHVLKRSFHDCDRVYLESLVGGNAALNVFCVHAWLKKSIVGPRPLPFFIKIAGPQAISLERHNYRAYADFFIPFYLRPNVVPERCVESEKVSSIVGNFVEESRPLREILRSSQSPGIIFSLFENSLKGFRSQPPDGVSDTWDAELSDFVKDRAQTTDIPLEIIESARELGLSSTSTETEATLIQKTAGMRRPFRAYHGDLHPGNVMVRGKDAIVIDFSAVKRGPITADPATLEVGLVFGTDKRDQLKQFDDWKSFVDEIYNTFPVHQPPLPETTPGPFSWLRRAVREVRHVLLGCDCEQCETSAVLATYLLRFARLPVEGNAASPMRKLAVLRHSYALVVAERLVAALPLCKPIS